MTRTISTPEELDALPETNVLLLASGMYPDGGGFTDCWVRPIPSFITGIGDDGPRAWEVMVYGGSMSTNVVETEHLTLPVTVLLDPSAPSVPAPDPDDREALLDLELVYVRSNDTDGHGPIGIRGNEEAADLVLSAGFRRLTVTPEMIEAGAKELARLDLCLPSRDRRPAARAVLEAALGDTK